MSDMINEYKPMKNPEMSKLFTELHDVNEQLKVLQATKKELEKRYKPLIEQGFKDDLYFTLPNQQRFSITKSQRKGGLDDKKLAHVLSGIGFEVDEFRKPSSTIYTLRFKD